jgi:hypothetical protein
VSALEAGGGPATPERSSRRSVTSALESVFDMANNLNLRVFSSHTAAGHNFNARHVSIGAAVLLLCWMVLGWVRASSDTAKIAALERKLAFLEAKEAQARLAMAQEVQKAITESAMLSTIATGAGGGSKTFPTVLHLPAHLKKRILVTGGAGFVGSHLVDALMLQGHYVTVMDNLFTGRISNLAHWMGHPNFQFAQHDVTQVRGAGQEPPSLSV